MCTFGKYSTGNSVRRISLFLLLALAASLPEARAQKPKTIVVHARRFAFSPASITLKKGQPVKLVLVSDDVPHDLTVTGLGIDAQILKGKQTVLLITPTTVGDFSGGCSLYCGAGHSDMAWTIHVVE